MPRARSICKRSGCPRPADMDGWCGEDWRKYGPGSRPSTVARGYGAKHQKRRATTKAEAIGHLCPLCRRAMLQGQLLHLHHSEPLASIAPEERAEHSGDEMTHAACNEAARRDTGRLDPDRPLPDITWESGWPH